jgi:hypothetical protein
VNVEPFVSPVFPIEKVQEALDAARDRLGGKIAIEFEP